METLYEEIFEGKHPRKCEDCMHYDVCHEYEDVAEMNPDDCDLYEEEGRSLYDDIYGRERELPDDRTAEDGQHGHKTFEEECAEGRFSIKPNRSIEEKREIVRRTALTSEMTYEERLEMQRRRYGL